MPTPSADQFDAVLLVLDGVPTGTMALHPRASTPGSMVSGMDTSHPGSRSNLSRLKVTTEPTSSGWSAI